MVRRAPGLSCEGLELSYRAASRSTVGPWSMGLRQGTQMSLGEFLGGKECFWPMAERG